MRFSTADDALAVWTEGGGSLETPDLDNALVSCEASSAEGNQVHILMTGKTSTVTVTTQSLTGPPPPAGDEWEDVVELSVFANGPMVVTELVEVSPAHPLTSESGAFRLRLARADGAPKDRERYLIQAWPEKQSATVVLRMDSRFAASLQARDEVVRQAWPAQLAAARIGTDLDQGPSARTLSGKLGTVTVTRDIEARRSKLFGYLLRGFLGWSGRGGPLPDITKREPFHDSPPLDGSEPLCGHSNEGVLKRVLLEEISPKLRVQSFAWLFPEPGLLLDKWTRQFPPGGTTVTTTWEEKKDAGGVVHTTITIVHERLPVEWLDDMSDWWSNQLNLIDWHARFRR